MLSQADQASGWAGVAPDAPCGKGAVPERPAFWQWIQRRGLALDYVAEEIGISRSLLYSVTRAEADRHFKYASFEVRLRVWSYTGGEIGFLDWPEPPGCRVPQFVFDPQLRGGGQ